MTSSKTNIKSKRLEARITAEQKSMFQHAADLLGLSLTDFTISSLQEKAKRVIQDHEIIQLSQQETELFVNALFNSAKPNKNLLKAAVRHSREVDAG